MQNQCAAAVSEYEISEDQKIVQGIPEFATGLRAGYKECATKGVLLRDEYRQQANATDQVYNEAVALFTRIAGLKQTSADLWKADFDPELERARSDLAHRESGRDLAEILETFHAQGDRRTSGKDENHA